MWVEIVQSASVSPTATSAGTYGTNTVTVYAAGPAPQPQQSYNEPIYIEAEPQIDYRPLRTFPSFKPPKQIASRLTVRAQEARPRASMTIRALDRNMWK